MKIVRISFVVAAALLARPVAAPAASDPCKLLTFAEAARAIGQLVVRSKERSVGAASCSYKSASFRSLVVTIEPFPSPAKARSEYEATIAASGTQDPPVVELSGIGDAARRLGSMIYVLKGSTVYAFTLVSPNTSGAGTLRTIALVKSVAPRL